MRLFCMPFAGGSAKDFRKWQEFLRPGIEVCAVELPGRGGRLKETPFDLIDPLLDTLELNLFRELDRPFAFFGHSFGGLLAFELAHRLSASGVHPVHLFVSGRCAPQTPTELPFRHDSPEAMLLKELRKLGGTPIQVLEDAELMRLLLPALRADLAVLESYNYRGERPKLTCPISAFGGVHDPIVKPAMYDAWRQLTLSSFSLELFPGGHFFFQKEQTTFLETLVRHLRGRHGPQPESLVK